MLNASRRAGPSRMRFTRPFPIPAQAHGARRPPGLPPRRAFSATPARCNYYKTLQVKRDATAEEIKMQYFTLAKQYHPDIQSGPDAQQLFLSLGEAYGTLRDAGKRAAYDRTLVAEREKASRPAPAPASTSARSRPATAGFQYGGMDTKRQEDIQARARERVREMRAERERAAAAAAAAGSQASRPKPEAPKPTKAKPAAGSPANARPAAASASGAASGSSSAYERYLADQRAAAAQRAAEIRAREERAKAEAEAQYRELEAELDKMSDAQKALLARRIEERRRFETLSPYEQEQEMLREDREEIEAKRRAMSGNLQAHLRGRAGAAQAAAPKPAQKPRSEREREFMISEEDKAIAAKALADEEDPEMQRKYMLNTGIYFVGIVVALLFISDSAAEALAIGELVVEPASPASAPDANANPPVGTDANASPTTSAVAAPASVEPSASDTDAGAGQTPSPPPSRDAAGPSMSSLGRSPGDAAGPAHSPDAVPSPLATAEAFVRERSPSSSAAAVPAVGVPTDDQAFKHAPGPEDASSLQSAPAPNRRSWWKQW